MVEEVHIVTQDRSAYATASLNNEQAYLVSPRLFDTGLVSTIIPVFNRARMLKEAVSSVLEQTYRPIEIIIVNDGSIDETAKVADLLASENPDEIRVVHQSNTGPGLAREAGRKQARGE